MNTSNQPKHSTGFAIFEIMIALVIGIALATTAMVVFGTTIGSGRVAQAQAWIGQTVDKTRASYMSSADFGVLTQASALHDGLFPGASMAGGQGPKNPWGGDFAMTAVDTTDGPATGLAITMDQIPMAECVKLGSVMGASAYITVDGTNVADGKTGADQAALGVTCNAGSDGVRMQFLYAKR